MKSIFIFVILSAFQSVNAGEASEAKSAATTAKVTLNRQPSALDGDVTLKSEALAAIKGHAGTEVVQIVDKTRGVVCYLISNQLSCVKYN